MAVAPWWYRNEETAEASIVDVGSGSVRARVSVGVEPEGVAARPDGAVVYVTSEETDRVHVLDAATARVIASIATGRRPRDRVHPGLRPSLRQPAAWRSSPDGLALPCHPARDLPLEWWNVRERATADIWHRAPGFLAFRGEEWMRSRLTTTRLRSMRPLTRRIT